MIDWQGVDVSDRARDNDPDELPALHRPEAEAGAGRLLLEAPVLLVGAAVIALVVKAFLAQAFFIPSESMEPQLATGDRVVVSRLSYQLHEPRRGDVVVFDDPTQPEAVDRSLLPVRLGREALAALGVIEPRGRELIKRVVALPGETVWGQAGQVVVDGRALTEPYLADPSITDDFAPVRIPEGHVFVMGDSRRNSKDSRRFGPVPEELVVGRAIARVWPPGRVAHL